MERTSKENYYLDIAQTVATRGTCLRRLYGAVIVKNDVIVSSGYAGAPRGCKNCCDVGFCLRQKLGIPRFERYEMCRAVHSEANAIIAAPRELMIGATMYQSCLNADTMELESDIDSCQMCKRMIINAGIEYMIYRITATEFRKVAVKDWIDADDIPL